MSAVSPRRKSAPVAAPSRPRRRTVASVADLVQVLRRRIALQDIAPGAKLRENELADEFGVPRTRIRDVLAVLERRGLVERIPNRGAVVTRLDLSQMVYIYDIREVLEGLCARLAALHARPERWARDLELFRGPMKELVARGEFEAYIGQYESLRRRLIDAAGNPILTEMLDTIYEKTQVLIRRIIILPGRAEMGRRQHVAMLAAMCRGDAEEAERLRRAGLRSAKAHFERYQKFIL